METDFPPNWTRKEEIIMCGLKDHPSKVVKRVGEGVSSREPMDFQQDKDMTHVEAPSSMMVLLNNMFCIHNVNLEGYMIRKVRLHFSSIKLHNELA
jgi:hypothetical protein